MTRVMMENALPGTSAWRLDLPARKHEVEGYASRVSARPNESVQIKVSVDQPQLVHYELYRMGYYQGLGGRFIASSPSQQISPQPPCPANATTGLVECAWETAFEVEIDPEWLTGQYFFKLVTESGVASYVPLVVREAKPTAPVVFQSSVTTWQAYNVYGGSSLYRNYLPAELGFKGKHANAVSFNRPYTCQDLNAEGCEPGDGDFDMGERWMSQFIEKKGVEVAYVTNLDVDLEGPPLLTGRSLFMTVGHDEYWPINERDTLETMRDNGLDLAFMSANTGYWRVRIEPASDGEERRTVVCYKDAKLDPRHGVAETTFEYRYEPMPRPEEALLGVMYDDDISRTYFDGFAQVVASPGHWVFHGTGVREFDALAHVTGYEWDRASSAAYAPLGREILAHASVFNVHGQQIAADVSIYYPTAESFVFAAGSIYWSRALAMPQYLDGRIQRMFENVLRRSGADLELTDLSMQEIEEPDETTMTVVAGSGVDGSSDGPALEAEFGAPVGIALAPDQTLYVVDSTRHAVRKIAPDGRVSTVAGCGHKGKDDGRGTAACFRFPTGLALGKDGTLYVADTGSKLIRSISPDGDVKTIAGGGKMDLRDTSDPLQAALPDPRGLALGPDGTLYIATQDNVVKLDPSGLHWITAGHQPTAVTVAPDATLFTIETRGGVLRHYTPTSVETVGVDGKFGDLDGDAQQTRLRPADGIAMDGDSVVFTDSANHKLRRYDPDSKTVTTLAGSSANVSDLQSPRGVIVTNKGYIVADTGNHRIVRVARK